MAIRFSKSYALGEWLLEPDTQRFSRDGERVHLANRPFQVLLYLVENRDRVVTRRELLEHFWDGKDVYDATLTQCVGAIRRALEDHRDSSRFIETRWAGGYRYVGPVEERADAFDTSVVEVERTRGFAVVVEEEVQDAAPADEVHANAPSLVVVESVASAPAPAALSSAGNNGLPASQLSRRAWAVTLAVATIALAAVVFAALRSGSRPTVSSAESPAPIRSIAVLPLKNLSGDPAQEYFSDGLTESLITKLAQTDKLKVISRSSAFIFKGKETDPREVGRRLGVATVLEGGVRRSGEMVRVEVRLVSAEDGRVLWADDTAERSLGDIFEIQDGIACRLTEQLRALLCGEAQTAGRYTKNTEAYEAYLKGRYFWNKRTGEDFKKAIGHFERAIAIDPNFALAHAGLADCYQLGVWFIPLEPREATPKTKAAALSAVQLDDNLAEAHSALAGAYAMEWNWPGVEREMKRAIELNPGYADAHHQYSLYLNYMKQPAESLAAIKRAQELDPLSLVIAADVGLAFYYARRYDEAIAAFRTALELDPNFSMAMYHLGDAYARKGMYPEAIAELRRAVALSGRNPNYLSALGQAYAHAGQRTEAQQALADLNDSATQRYVPAYSRATLYAALGQKEQALLWLEKIYAERAAHIVNLPVEPVFDSLRSDARFTDLLKRAGLPQ